MFKLREKVNVLTSEGKVEGYVYYIFNPKQVYVVLTGQNTKPVLIDTSMIESIDVPPPKRGRGRPRKEKK